MASEYIFLTDQHGYEEGVFVAKREWFKSMPISELFTDFGQPVEVERGCDYCDDCDGSDKYDCDCEECIDNLPKVVAYNYHDGRKWQSLVIEADDHEPRWVEITDKAEIEKYETAMERMEHQYERGGIDYFKAPGFDIQQSRFQTAWELYTIKEREDDEDEEDSDDEN